MTDITTTLAASGIDPGDKDAYHRCLNEEGKLTEEGTVAMTPAGLRKHFAKIPRSNIAIEAGTQSRWIAKTLGEFGQAEASGKAVDKSSPNLVLGEHS